MLAVIEDYAFVSCFKSKKSTRGLLIISVEFAVLLPLLTGKVMIVIIILTDIAIGIFIATDIIILIIVIIINHIMTVITITLI